MQPTAPEPAPRSSRAVSLDGLVVAALTGLPYLLLLFVITFGTVIGAERVTNPDTYFHLRYGDEFWSHWSPWHPGSVTRFATRPWLPTQWLSEIVMGRFGVWFGLPGVAWLTGAWILAYALAVYLVCRRWTTNLVAVTLTALAIMGSTLSLSGRPQVLSYALLAVVVGAWIATSRDGRPRWWLLAVAWVWPLIHGMWLLGLVTSFAAAAGIALDRRRTLDRSSAVRLFGLPIGMAVLSALTPIGPGLYPAVALVGGRGHFVTEWGPPNYVAHPTYVITGFLVLLLVVVALRRAPASWFLVAMVVVTGVWSIYSARTIPVAAATAAPLAAAVIGDRLRVRGATPSARVDRRVAMIATLVALVVLAVVVPTTAAKPRPYPRWVNSELDRLPAGTAVLTADFDGSFLMWAHPDLDLVANGYFDSFTDAELQRDIDLVTLQPDWRQILSNLQVHVAILDPDQPLAYALISEEHWQVRHRSAQLVYLTAPRA